jgi:prepilin-type N-terminal cleavage/methylation domain-containing protein/prepilin-type processing-associated H-X9-DG protein
MYRSKKAFTLIELLVVISIIALLLSILMPSLTKVRDMGKRTVCLSLMKSFAMANTLYSATYNGKYYVPFSQAPRSTVGHEGWDERWCENTDFRSFISVSDRKQVVNSWNDPFIFPKELRCPAHKIGNNEQAYLEQFLGQYASKGWTQWRNVMSIALNTEQWRDENWYPADGKLRVHKTVDIKSPSSVMMFIDSNMYQTRYIASDYNIYWGKYGDTIRIENMGQVAYRHGDTADLSYFDGHAGNLKKTLIYDSKNCPVRSYAPTNRNFNQLWDTNKEGLKTR